MIGTTILNPLEKIEHNKLTASQDLVNNYYNLSNNVNVKNIDKLMKFADIEIESLLEENNTNDVDLSQLLDLDIDNKINNEKNFIDNKSSNNNLESHEKNEINIASDNILNQGKLNKLDVDDDNEDENL